MGVHPHLLHWVLGPWAAHGGATGAGSLTYVEYCLSLALLPDGCVTQGKSLHLSEPFYSSVMGDGELSVQSGTVYEAM